MSNMKISNRHVELEMSLDDSDQSATIRFPSTKAHMTITKEELKQLYIALSHLYD